MATETASNGYKTFTGEDPQEAGAPEAAPLLPDEGLHPQQRAWCGSRLLLSWVLPLMRLGHDKQLDATDIWPLREKLQTDHILHEFATPLKRHGNSIPRAFFVVFGLRFFLTGAALLVSMLCNLVGPVALDRVVSALSNEYEGQGDSAITTATLWVALVFAAQVLQALADCYSSLQLQVIAIQLVAALKSMLYRKSLRLSARSRQAQSTGALTNMFTSDCDQLVRTAMIAHQAWLVPLQIVVGSYLLVNELGVAAFAGIGIIIVLLLVNHLISKRIFKLRRNCRSAKDIRMKKVAEAFKAVGIVKLNAWEDPITKRIDDARDTEMHSLLRLYIMISLSIVLMWGMPVFICIGAFGTFSVVLRHELTPAIVFTSLALFNLIQQPLRGLTFVISQLIQSKVALERVTSFLEMPEIDPHSVISTDDPASEPYVAKGIAIAVEGGEFSWNGDDESSTVLKDVNLEVKAGEFLVVHGTVGCGKSSLCSALLGEMEKRRGTVFVGGSVAYCSQQAWIQNMTVRDNILFGKPFDRKKYDKVLDACALKADLASLPAGDETEIGERGVNVSGGQQARIALARACYSDASVYILDSPLSAVDAIVQNEIFQKCLLGLLKHKTVVLVTHNPEIISSEYITRAMTVDDIGTLVETRRVETEMEYQPLVSPLPKYAFTSVEKDSATQPTNSTNDDTPSEDELNAVAGEMALNSPFAAEKLRALKPGPLAYDEMPGAIFENEQRGKLIADEVRSVGRVKRHIFAAYYHAVGGLPVVGGILLCQSIWQGLQIGSDFWLSSWSNDAAAEDEASSTSYAHTVYRLSIYSTLGLLAAFMVFIRTLIVTFRGLHAARNLFDRMTHALMHAPLRFFDANPIGRVLTRYGSDVSTVDEQIPFMFGTLATEVFSTGCSLATAALVIRWKGLFLLPVVAVYAWVGMFYIPPARELQRLLKTTQAPVLNHMTETADGASVVRAFGPRQVLRFFETSRTKVDENNKVWYAQVYISQWFSLRIQLVGSALLLVVTSSLVLLRHELNAAIIGLAFSYALRVSANLEGIVRVLTQVETTMVSPERLQEYIDIEQEAPSRVPMMDPPAQSEWPSEGALQFDKVSFRYKPGGDLVLRNLSFSVSGGQKIGIVGRTGAGKSSLTNALFRINELAGGCISIDGVDVSRIGLKTLREKLSIIPQSPVLFKGSLRSYLDPFEDFSDEQLWTSLKHVGLEARVGEDELKLQLVVEENGENFSVGERQMLCMARALLRHSRIVIFDEATAAIDRETDHRLQRVIRTAFAQSTVLTIAHRLDTILDSDRILVMDGGRVVEFAPPAELVQKGEGHFFELIREGGYMNTFEGQEV